MLQFEAATLWKRLQAAKATVDKARARRLQAEYDKFLAHYPSGDDAIEKRLNGIEKTLGIVRAGRPCMSQCIHSGETATSHR
jgi:hypothetical protein